MNRPDCGYHERRRWGMGQEPIEERFREALEALVEQVKEDRSVLAAILCGSLSHDKVWAKSDIDLVLVTIDDKKVEAGDLALYADGVNVHAFLVAAGRIPQDGRKGRSATRSCTRSWPRGGCSTPMMRRSPTSAPGCARSASATRRSSSCARRRTRSGRSTRPTSGSSPAATWTTRRSGSSTPRRRWRRSRSSAGGCSPTGR